MLAQRVAADGSRIAQAKQPRQTKVTQAQGQLLPVPMPTELTRADSKTQLTRLERKNSAYALKTELHAPTGDHYVVITDHKAKAFLQPLHRLVKHHNGTLFEIDNLATLHLDRNCAKFLLARLQSLQPRFVAVAPRIESFRENMLLRFWELLAQIDEVSNWTPTLEYWSRPSRMDLRAWLNNRLPTDRNRKSN